MPKFRVKFNHRKMRESERGRNHDNVWNGPKKSSYACFVSRVRQVEMRFCVLCVVVKLETRGGLFFFLRVFRARLRGRLWEKPEGAGGV